MVSFFQNIILLKATLYLINSLLGKNRKATCIGKSWNHSKTLHTRLAGNKENRIEKNKKNHTKIENIYKKKLKH